MIYKTLGVSVLAWTVGSVGVKRLYRTLATDFMAELISAEHLGHLRRGHLGLHVRRGQGNGSPCHLKLKLLLR